MFTPEIHSFSDTLAGYSTLWKFRVNISKKQHLIYYDCHKKYGKVFRDGPNSLSFWDVEAVKKIYCTGKNPFPRADNFGAPPFSPDHPPIFFSISAKMHQKARRQVGGAYAMSSILAMEDQINDLILHWESRLNEEAENGQPFDQSKWTNYFTMDLITDLAFGNAFGFLANGSDVNGVMAQLQTPSPIFTAINFIPPLRALLFSTLFQKIAPLPQDNGIGYVRKMAEEIVDGLYKQPNEKKDLMNAIMNSKDADGNATHPDQVKGEAIAALVAGGDTTANSILGIMGFLLQNPHAFRKLRAEIDTADAQGLLSHELPTFAETQKLPYLDAVIHEGLRLAPSIPGTFDRQTPESIPSEVIKGVVVPPNVVVGVNTWVMGRDKSFYGPDAEEFKPERWLNEADRKKFKDYEFAFGHGVRICIGKNLAYVELYKCILELVREYDIKPVNSNKLWKEEAKLFLYKTEFMVYISHRNNKN